MGDITTANAAYSQVRDTVYDSKLLQGLAESGVLPNSFRVIKASIDFSSGTNGAVANGKPILDTTTGVQVQLPPLTQVLYASAVGTTALASGGAATVDLGFAATSTGAVTLALSAGTGFAAINTGVNPFPTAADVFLTTATEVYLTCDVNVAALTAGVMQVLLVIA